MQQESLFGVEQAPKPTDRLFFALFPDLDTAEQQIAPLASRLRAALQLRGKLLATERFHVTLHHLGDFVGVPQQLVQAARDVGAALRRAPFELAFNCAASFDNRRGRNNPFVLQGDEAMPPVLEFQRALGEAMKMVGLRPDTRFTPHVTLLYDDRVVPRQPVTPPVRWTAQEFVLVHSLIGQGVHVPLGRWQLQS